MGANIKKTHDFLKISHQKLRKLKVFSIFWSKYHENTTLFKLFPTTLVGVGLLNLQP